MLPRCQSYPILPYVNRSRDTNSFEDFIDGQFWRDIKREDHSDSSAGQIVFPYMLYYDDFETGNPLGSRAGVHKLGAVYASLKCLPPKFNAQLQNQFLVLLFYAEDRVKFGNETIFNILIEDINYLRTKGVKICVESKKYQLFFVMVQLLGDNLGLNSILRYVESFSVNYFC